MDGENLNKGGDQDLYIDQKDARKKKDLARAALRRERHLQQMDATKKMYIDQILNRNIICASFDLFGDDEDD